MIDVKPILNTGLAIQSSALAMDNLKAVKKKKSLVKTGVKNIIGISLIREQGKLINLV